MAPGPASARAQRDDRAGFKTVGGPAGAAMNWERLLRRSRIYNLLVRPRQPEAGPIFLAQRRVYILPTREGLVFAMALALMLIGSINYSLSLGYVLTFLLAGMGMVSILHTFRNLAHLSISAGRVDPVFAGDTARFTLHLENRRDVARHSINLACGAEPVSCDVGAERTETASVPVPAKRRGWLQLPRVTMDTRYPLGLLRAWAYVQPDMRAIVYPRPDESALPAPGAVPDAGEAASAGTGTDDFAGLRPYQPSDSPRHIAWKAVARGETMLTKVFSGRAAMELWFDWNDLPDGLGIEARLSRLARWVLLAHADGLRYGLALPGVVLAPGAGDAHKLNCLKHLALYEPGGAAVS